MAFSHGFSHSLLLPAIFIFLSVFSLGLAYFLWMCFYIWIVRVCNSYTQTILHPMKICLPCICVCNAHFWFQIQGLLYSRVFMWYYVLAVAKYHYSMRIISFESLSIKCNRNALRANHPTNQMIEKNNMNHKISMGKMCAYPTNRSRRERVENVKKRKGSVQKVVAHYHTHESYIFPYI